MNERTEALAKQAAEYAIEFATQDQEQYIPKLMEKFAELIVRECIELAADSQYENTRNDYYEGFNEALIYIGIKIRKHFGVE